MNDKDHIIETFTELAPRYEEVVNAELGRFWGWSYAGFVNQLIQSTPMPEKGKMLDLATGTGVIPITVATNGLSTNRIHGLGHSQIPVERSGMDGNATAEQLARETDQCLRSSPRLLAP